MKLIKLKDKSKKTPLGTLYYKNIVEVMIKMRHLCLYIKALNSFKGMYLGPLLDFKASLVESYFIHISIAD